MDHKTKLICKLNDRLRETFIGGQVMLTAAVSELTAQDRVAVLLKVRTHTEFTADNDPYGEHDFGAFDHNAIKYFWKIDYYDQTMQFASPDAADLAVKRRVLTIMQASEY